MRRLVLWLVAVGMAASFLTGCCLMEGKDKKKEAAKPATSAPVKK